MPINEYRREDCKTTFEKLVRSSSESAELACPSCGQKHLTPQLSTFAAHTNVSGKSAPAPAMCPSGGVCPTPGACGLN